MALQPRPEVRRPVERRHRRERRDHVLERVRERRDPPVRDAEEPTREIVERALAAGQLADSRVDVEPEQRTFE